MQLVCPGCGGQLLVIGAVIKYHLSRGVEGNILACVRCPMATEVNSENARLVDWGHLVLRDVQVDEDTYVMQHETPLRGRRDS